MMSASSAEDELFGASNRPLKRRYTTSSELTFFTPASESFNPRPYLPPHSSISVPHSKLYSMTSASRNAVSADAAAAAIKPFEPTPDDPTALFIRPPFDDFPDSHIYPDGLTYNILAENPEWFLDAADFRDELNANPDGIPYPQSLEPPRGWCPTTKKKESKGRTSDPLSDEDTPKLRCTFCRRKYAGVNAKSMWRRHVLEKHKIAMSNRRDVPSEGGSGRGGRSSNKENRGLQRGGRSSQQLNRSKSASFGNIPSTHYSDSGGAHRHGKSLDNTKLRTLLPTGRTIYDTSFEEDTPRSSSEEVDRHLMDEHLQSPCTSPRLSSCDVPLISSPQRNGSHKLEPPVELSYDRAESPKLKRVTIKEKVQQPLKYTSPSHPLYTSPEELYVGVAIGGIAGEGLRSAYVALQSSPLGPDSSNRRPTMLPNSPLNTSPLCSKIVNGRVLGWKRCASDSRLRAQPTGQQAEPRRLFSYTSSLPVPVADRTELSPELSYRNDEPSTADSSFVSELDDPFNAWFDMNGVAQVHESNTDVFADLSSNPIITSSPVMHSTSIPRGGQDRHLDVETSSWQRQGSGVGLGISMNTSDGCGTSKDYFTFSMSTTTPVKRGSLNDFARQLDEDLEFDGELMYPPLSQDEVDLSGEDSAVQMMQMAIDLSPPLKRRRTVW